MPVAVRTSFAIGYTVAMSGAALAASRRDPSGLALRDVARTWARTMCERAGLDVRVERPAATDWARPLVVMSTHTSHFDIPVLWSVLPEPFGMLAKKELFEIPLFGRAMGHTGCVPIDRADREGSREAIRAAATLVREGRSIVVFPEGTRGDGGDVRPLKKGPFFLVESARVPILPVALVGTHAVLPRGSLALRPGIVRVRFGAPIEHEGEGAAARDATRARVHAALAALAT